jgi:hypothetical protein
MDGSNDRFWRSLLCAVFTRLTNARLNRLLLQPYKLRMPPAELPGKGLQRIMACAFRAPDIIETPFAAVIATGCLVAPMGGRLGVIQGHHNRGRSGGDRRQTPCVPKTALGVPFSGPELANLC